MPTSKTDAQGEIRRDDNHATWRKKGTVLQWLKGLCVRVGSKTKEIQFTDQSEDNLCFFT